MTFSADASVHDGRFANNPWLQELPKPLNKVTWDNVLIMSPRTAEKFGIAAQKMTKYQATVATVTLNGRSVAGPGVGAGRSSRQLGQPAARVRPHARRPGRHGPRLQREPGAPVVGALLRASARRCRPTGDTYTVASTQMHFNMEQRAVVRTAPLPLYKAEPTFAQHMTHVPKYEDTLHGNEWQYEGYKWGMVIDLNACDGCNACVVACVSENNIPVVGKAQVAAGREMHWIRIDRYYEGDLDNPTVHDQPLTCMQCENAPCEVVCPVAATVHNQEGLNDMVYNRCVGTRYCANNCPYKVRRFNFLLYADWDTKALKMARNPGSHGAQPRRDGEVHVLRAAHQLGAHHVQARGSAHPRRRDPHGLPERVPDAGDPLRRPERPRAAASRSCAASRATTACSRISTRGRARRTWPRCATRTRCSPRRRRTCPRRRSRAPAEGHGAAGRPRPTASGKAAAPAAPATTH